MFHLKAKKIFDISLKKIIKDQLLFIIAGFGILVGVISVYIYNVKANPLPPIGASYNPYITGIYATGIIESNQKNGSNINIFPDVSGKVVKIFTVDGQEVKAGDPILAIDDSVQREIVAKDIAEVNAALALLQKLKAEPRKENLDVAKAQFDYAKANLKNVIDQLNKVKQSYKINPKSVSKNVLDNAINAVKIAKENLKVAEAEYNLMKAGAWEYDIKNQENQYQALIKTYQSDNALLDKYLIKSSIDGVILRVNPALGSYVSPQGSYDTYTQGMNPVIVMGVLDPYLEVRCYLNEILVPKLPKQENMQAKIFIRGENNKSIPVEFVRIQPYTIPNIELSNQRQERVD
ncbi:MAG: glycosyl hydrolase family 18, partial [Gammaproteobacteria bacterium GWE2_37_16]